MTIKSSNYKGLDEQPLLAGGAIGLGIGWFYHREDPFTRGALNRMVSYTGLGVVIAFAIQYTTRSLMMFKKLNN